jgi:hypothetical protein
MNGASGPIPVVLVRARKQRRKDGTPVPQSGPWSELSVFDDTITKVGGVGGAWNADVPTIPDLPTTPTTTSPSAGDVAALTGTSSAPRDPATDVERIRAAAHAGVIRPILHHMAAIAILDGADPLLAQAAAAERNASPATLRAPGVVKAPRSIDTSDDTHGDGGTPADAVTLHDITPTSTAVTAKPDTGGVPAPRRVRACITDAHIISLQRLADTAGIERRHLNTWAMHRFQRELRDIARDDAVATIDHFRALNREEGIALFHAQVQEALNGLP